MRSISSVILLYTHLFEVGGGGDFPFPLLPGIAPAIVGGGDTAFLVCMFENATGFYKKPFHF
jgi:hypothetical protein